MLKELSLVSSALSLECYVILDSKIIIISTCKRSTMITTTQKCCKGLTCVNMIKLGSV